jgi:hypothetical protein
MFRRAAESDVLAERRSASKSWFLLTAATNCAGSFTTLSSACLRLRISSISRSVWALHPPILRRIRFEEPLPDCQCFIQHRRLAVNQSGIEERPQCGVFLHIGPRREGARETPSISDTGPPLHRRASSPASFRRPWTPARRLSPDTLRPLLNVDRHLIAAIGRRRVA